MAMAAANGVGYRNVCVKTSKKRNRKLLAAKRERKQ